MIRIDKILYATDFSSYSNQAYFHAIALAEHHGANLTILFVLSPQMAAAGAPRSAARPSVTGENNWSRFGRWTRTSSSTTSCSKATRPRRSCATAETRAWT